MKKSKITKVKKKTYKDIPWLDHQFQVDKHDSGKLITHVFTGQELDRIMRMLYLCGLTSDDLAECVEVTPIVNFDGSGPVMFSWYLSMDKDLVETRKVRRDAGMTLL